MESRTRTLLVYASFLPVAAGVIFFLRWAIAGGPQSLPNGGVPSIPQLPIQVAQFIASIEATSIPGTGVQMGIGGTCILIALILVGLLTLAMLTADQISAAGLEKAGSPVVVQAEVIYPYVGPHFRVQPMGQPVDLNGTGVLTQALRRGRARILASGLRNHPPYTHIVRHRHRGENTDYLVQLETATVPALARSS